MKKILLTLCIAFIAFWASGQSILNGTFESWTTNTYSYPVHLQYNSTLENASSFLSHSASANVLKTTNAYNNYYALKLVTRLVGSDTVVGYALNASPNNGSVSTWHGGFPLSEKPSGFRGYYMYNVATADSALVIVVFSKSGQNVGTFTKKLGGLHTSYASFNMDLSSLSTTPDSVIVAFTSSYTVMSGAKGPLGSTLIVDSVSFTGVTNQPTGFDGDFETWSDSTMNIPASWYLENGDQSIAGVSRTTDAHKGTYAVQLKTYSGLSSSSSNTKIARPGYISTGYYDNNCGSNCVPRGGQPYTQQIDTLSFYYKYTPSGNDSALVSVNLKKSGTPIGWYSATLHAASGWTYVTIPITNGTIPDSVVVSAQSSCYGDSAISYVGSTLILDNIEFKSQTLTSIFNAKADKSVNIYPNPASDAIQISGLTANAAIEISDVNGKLFLSKKVNPAEMVSLSTLPLGVYLVKIDTGSAVVERKLVKK